MGFSISKLSFLNQDKAILFSRCALRPVKYVRLFHLVILDQTPGPWWTRVRWVLISDDNFKSTIVWEGSPQDANAWKEKGEVPLLVVFSKPAFKRKILFKSWLSPRYFNSTTAKLRAFLQRLCASLVHWLTSSKLQSRLSLLAQSNFPLIVVRSQNWTKTLKARWPDEDDLPWLSRSNLSRLRNYFPSWQLLTTA